MLPAGKTHAQLQQTQNSIEEQLQSGEAADPEFSAAILKRLRIHKAKAKLREIHSDLLQRHLDRTQLVGDSVDVADEMGWGDEEVQMPVIAAVIDWTRDPSGMLLLMPMVVLPSLLLSVTLLATLLLVPLMLQLCSPC